MRTTTWVVVTLAQVQVASGFVHRLARLPPTSTLPCARLQSGGVVARPAQVAQSAIIRRASSLTQKISSSSSSTTETTKTGDPTKHPADWRSQILTALSSIIDPDLNSDIVTLGFVQNLFIENSSVVSLNLHLTTPELVQQCEDAIDSIEWTRGAVVTLAARHVEAPIPGAPQGMSQIGSIIAVSSCKGGVGKSTTAVNLAYSLRGLGASVGIFDADVYGPSLPTMVAPEDDDVLFVGRQIAPLRREGVSLMSFGYVNEGSAVMRGPMVTQLLDQFLSLTNWGPLDYLILDMPPGTGDIQLTLSQRLNITAAVIVTTPQELSFVDVERGVEMFDTVNVPCVAVVENMAYFKKEREGMEVQIDELSLRENFLGALQKDGRLDDGNVAVDVVDDLVRIVQENIENLNATGEREEILIFGSGHKRRLSEQWGIDYTYSIPLMGKIAENGDSGTPFVLDNPCSPQAEIYRQLAKSVVSEVAKMNFGTGWGGRPVVAYDAETHTIRVEGGGRGGGGEISPAELRRGCRCALCVEELTGKQILNPQSVPESIRPASMSPTGNYALSVDWSDGHRSLYPYRQIRSMLADARADEKEEDATVAAATGDREKAAI